jgi:hypothetical protein
MVIWSAAAIAALMGSLVLLALLRKHRRDIASTEPWTAGSSRFWQVNVLKPANYSSRGKLLLTVYWICVVLFMFAASKLASY